MNGPPRPLRDPAAPAVVFADACSVAALTSTMTPFDVGAGLVARVVSCGRGLVDEMDRLCGMHTAFMAAGGRTCSRALVECRARMRAATGFAEVGPCGAFGAAVLAAEATHMLVDRRTLAVVQPP